MILLSLITLALAALLAWQFKAARSGEGASALLADAQRREQEALAELARLRAELEQSRLAEREARVHSEETVKRLEHQQKAVDELKAVFQASASDAMGKSTREFMALAEEKLKGISGQMEGELKLKTGAVESLVQPLNDKIEQLRRAAEDLGKAHKGGEEGLKALIQNVQEGQERLRMETGALASAMGNNQARGQWGEMVLERILEWAGMREGVHYRTQVVAGPDNSVKPDLILMLPGGREVVVDSKAVLDAYLQATQEKDPARRSELLQQHAKNLRTTIDGLSRKGYLEQFSKAPDFVVLFLPADVFLQAALEADSELFERAYQKKIMLTTPSSFMAMLKIVEKTWAQADMAENAVEISKKATELRDRLITFMGHIAKMGRDLGGAVDGYNSMVGSLKSSVLPATADLKKLGVAASKPPDAKSNPELIEQSPRSGDIEQLRLISSKQEN